MIKLKHILFFLVVMCMSTFIPLTNTDANTLYVSDPLGICTFEDFGCQYFVVEFGNGYGEAYMNCNDGNGLLFTGRGLYGGCPGVYEPW